MTSTNFPNGITSMGVPYPGGGGTLPMAQNYFYVCSVNGSNGNEGTSQDAPFATIDYAIGKCTADKGDVIVVMQNHAETLTAAGAIACDVAGVNIIGLGTGTDRPELTFSTSTGASVLITAANVQIANIVGISGIDGLTQPFDIRAAGCTLGNFVNGPVEWQDPDNTKQAVRQVLTTSAADNLNINLNVRGIISGGTSPVNSIRLVGVDTAKIILDFYGRASTSVVQFLTTACTNVEIYGYMYNSGVTDFSKDVIDTVTGSTWFASFYDGAFGGQVSGGSAAALASDDVSSLSSAVSTGVWHLATKTIANAATSLTTGASPVTLFTVTGDVIVRVWATVQTTITSTLNNGTLALGVPNSTSAFIAATTMDGTNFTAKHSWYGATTTALAGAFNSTATFPSAANGTSLAGSQNIILTVATNSATAGAITFYCYYLPVSSNASVVAA
ncbi:MAG TPA: hypothetical protein VI358_18065 [Pseudolabrys sp.]